MNPPEHTAVRLTTADSDAMEKAVTTAIRGWRRSTGDPHYSPRGADVEALRRLGAHAIGCSIDDLRDAEVDILDGIIAAAVGAPS